MTIDAGLDENIIHCWTQVSISNWLNYVKFTTALPIILNLNYQLFGHFSNTQIGSNCTPFDCQDTEVVLSWSFPRTLGFCTHSRRSTSSPERPPNLPRSPTLVPIGFTISKFNSTSHTLTLRAESIWQQQTLPFKTSKQFKPVSQIQGTSPHQVRPSICPW